MMKVCLVLFLLVSVDCLTASLFTKFLFPAWRSFIVSFSLMAMFFSSLCERTHFRIAANYHSSILSVPLSTTHIQSYKSLVLAMASPMVYFRLPSPKMYTSSSPNAVKINCSDVWSTIDASFSWDFTQHPKKDPH